MRPRNNIKHIVFLSPWGMFRFVFLGRKLRSSFYKKSVTSATVALFLFSIISPAQDYSFDGTWEGTYYHQNQKLEIFFPRENSHEYYCALKENNQEINCLCFATGDNFFVLGKGEIFFQLSSDNFNLKTNSEYSFYPEPIIEGDYSEYENY